MLNDFWFHLLRFLFSWRCYVVLIALGLGFVFGILLLALPGAALLKLASRLVPAVAPTAADWPAAMLASWALPWCVPVLHWTRRWFRGLPRFARFARNMLGALVWAAAVVAAVHLWRAA